MKHDTVSSIKLATIADNKNNKDYSFLLEEVLSSLLELAKKGHYKCLYPLKAKKDSPNVAFLVRKLSMLGFSCDFSCTYYDEGLLTISWGDEGIKRS